MFLLLKVPHSMMNPGELTEAHAKQEHECFSCHIPFRGVSADKCMSCHRLDHIGVDSLSSVSSILKKTAFHDKLQKNQCIDCHTDHQGRTSTKPRFDHALLTSEMVGQCRTCHASPNSPMHLDSTRACSQCHVTTLWSQVHFAHEKLNGTTREACTPCHLKPNTSLHQSFSNDCGTCHTVNAWTPATFAHESYFRLDGDHQSPCVICHVQDNFQTYTCYGCHEHSKEKIAREHQKEGIRDFQKCVQCHRSANKHDIENKSSNDKNARGEKDHDDD
ncbi:class III cytochrome C family protein [bacterium]|nr:class III cytochrome C family protein [bacterium]NUN44729.1 class III cytochrome C family protein [bacterium]